MRSETCVAGADEDQEDPGGDELLYRGDAGGSGSRGVGEPNGRLPAGCPRGTASTLAQGAVGREKSDLAVLRGNAAGVLRQAADAVSASARAELSTALLSGRASREITRAAQDFKCDLLVVGAVGERGRSSRKPALGGTAAKLVASTTVPLLIVRTRPKRAPVRVLAAVDLMPVSHRVLHWAAAAPSCAQALADEFACSRIVMGTRAMGRLKSLVLDSTVYAVVSQAESAVTVIR